MGDTNFPHNLINILKSFILCLLIITPIQAQEDSEAALWDQFKQARKAPCYKIKYDSGRVISMKGKTIVGAAAGPCPMRLKNAKAFRFIHH